jgi:hypothetical protein
LARSGDPIGGDAIEFLRRHAGMSRSNELHRGLFTLRRKRFKIALEHRFERLLIFPIEIFGCKLPHAIKHERHLHVHGLLAPQRTVVVEGRDTLGGLDEIRRALFCYTRDEVCDCLFGSSIVPGRQWVARRWFRSACRAVVQSKE